MKRVFDVTLARADGSEVNRTLIFDPCDIYDAELASKVRRMARDLLSIDVNGKEVRRVGNDH